VSDATSPTYVVIPLEHAKTILTAMAAGQQRLSESSWDTIRRYGDDSPEDIANAAALNTVWEAMARLRKVVEMAEKK
jgi:hypothetical protein